MPTHQERLFHGIGSEGLHAKWWFDAVGHYSREDVLSPHGRAPARKPAPAPAPGSADGQD